MGHVRGLVSTAHVEELQHSATPLADIIQDVRTSYEAKITTIVDLLRRVAASPDLGQNTVDKSLNKVHAGMLRNNLFSIAVVGRMKVGKSTLLNILLGVDENGSKAPLPVEDNPCTATLIKIRLSDSPYCRPYGWDSLHTTRGEAMPDWTFEDFHQKARIYQNGSKTNIFDRIAEFEVGWRSSLLNAGVS